MAAMISTLVGMVMGVVALTIALLTSLAIATIHQLEIVLVTVANQCHALKCTSLKSSSTILIKVTWLAIETITVEMVSILTKVRGLCMGRRDTPINSSYFLPQIHLLLLPGILTQAVVIALLLITVTLLTITMTPLAITMVPGLLHNNTIPCILARFQTRTVTMTTKFLTVTSLVGSPLQPPTTTGHNPLQIPFPPYFCLVAIPNPLEETRSSTHTPIPHTASHWTFRRLRWTMKEREIQLMPGLGHFICEFLLLVVPPDRKWSLLSTITHACISIPPLPHLGYQSCFNIGLWRRVNLLAPPQM